MTTVTSSRPAARAGRAGFAHLLRAEWTKFRTVRGWVISVIVAMLHYPPNHLQPAFAAWNRPLPRTEQAAARVLSLPFHPALTGDDVQVVAACLKEALA